MSAAPKITAPRGEGVSLAVAADAFLATPRTVNPDTHRAYASAIDRVAAAAGWRTTPGRPPARRPLERAAQTCRAPGRGLPGARGSG
ncbi:hypothetical protein [Nonomuraea sp. NPDC001699]